MSAPTPQFLVWWDYFPKERLLNQKSLFGLFVTKRSPIKQGVDHVEGFSQDDYGRSTFQGELSSLTLRFTKMYDEDSIRRLGASSVLIHYRSFALRNGSYIGVWNYDNFPPTWQIPKHHRRYFIARPIGPMMGIDLATGSKTYINPLLEN